jgi:hypothetical protein
MFLLVLISLEKTLHAQTPHTPYIYTIKADSVKITNTCDTAELIIENHTQTVPGFLFNKGRGRTEFRRAISLSDSSLLLGGDTLVIRGNTNANNGVSVDAKTVQLGQLEGTPGNPAAFLSNREIPLNGKYLGFTGLGRIGIGTTAPRTILHINTSQTSIASSAVLDGAYFGHLMSTDHGVMGCCTTEYAILTSGNSTSVRGRFLLTKTRGSTSNPLAVQQGDIVGDFAVGASDGTSMFSRGLLRFLIDGPVSTGNVPTAMLFYSGINSTTERMRISSSGNIGVGTQNPTDRLHVVGSVKITDTLKVPNIVSQTDAVNFSPVVVDGSGNVFKMSGWNAPQLSRMAVSDAGYSVQSSDYFIAYTALSAARTVTLPAAATMTNRIIVIKDESGAAGTYSIIVNVTAGGTIDGASSKTITANYGSMEVYSSGSQWFLK